MSSSGWPFFSVTLESAFESYLAEESLLGRYLLLSLIEVSALEPWTCNWICANTVFPGLPFNPPTSGSLARSLAIIECHPGDDPSSHSEPTVRGRQVLMPGDQPLASFSMAQPLRALK